MDELIIKKDEILKFKTEAGKLIWKRDAESKLVELLDAKDKIDAFVEEVKRDITESGKKVIGEDFKGVFGERIKAVFRPYGYRFSTTNPDFIKQTVVERVDIEKIDVYLKEKGALPPDTTENIREGKLVIQRINEDTKALAT